MEAGDMMTRQELIIALTNAKENLGPLTDIESQEALAYNAYFRDKKYYETEIVRGTSHIGDFLLGYLLMGFVVFLLLNQITHPVREAFLVLSTAVASTAFFIYYKTHPKQRKTLRMTA